MQMNDIKRFQLNSNLESVTKLPSQHAKLEKELQQLIAISVDAFLGVRFLVTELTTSNAAAHRLPWYQ
jgi:hypothetical protein